MLICNAKNSFYRSLVMCSSPCNWPCIWARKLGQNKFKGQTKFTRSLTIICILRLSALWRPKTWSLQEKQEDISRSEVYEHNERAPCSTCPPCGGATYHTRISQDPNTWTAERMVSVVRREAAIHTFVNKLDKVLMTNLHTFFSNFWNHISFDKIFMKQ